MQVSIQLVKRNEQLQSRLPSANRKHLAACNLMRRNSVT
jgi:hypothetical protein